MHADIMRGSMHAAGRAASFGIFAIAWRSQMSSLLARRALLLSVTILVALAGGFMADTAQAKTGKAALGTWGIELTAMDKSVPPGDDFFRYTGGTWMKTTQIPAD